MLSANPFFKAPIDYSYNAKMPPKQIWTGKDEAMKVRQAMIEENKRRTEEGSKLSVPKYTPGASFGDMIRQAGHNNNSTRPFMGDPKFGFKTMLSGESKGLPTAPAIVGGNVDWTTKKVGPATMFLHHEIMNKRQMLPPPVMGSPLKVSEPTGFSLHTL